MSYTYYFNRKTTWDAKPDDFVDADITSSDAYPSSNYKAVTFTATFDKFICSPTSSGRHYSFTVEVNVNGQWKALRTEPKWWLPDSSVSSTSVTLTNLPVPEKDNLQSLIGQYGISDIRIRNEGGVNQYTDEWENWDLRGKSSGTGRIIFETIQNNTPIQPPKYIYASPTSTTTNSNIQISWSGQENGIGTSIISYDMAVVESSNQNNWWLYSNKYGSTIPANQSSATIQISQVGTYNIYVFAYDSQNNQQWSGAFVTVTIGTSSNPGKPTNLKVNNTNTIYIGKNNSPAISFSWTAPTNFGNYNSFKSYTLYKNGTAIKTNITSTSAINVYTTSSSVNNKIGEYTVRTLGTVTNTISEDSNIAKVVLISDPNVPTITSSLPSSTNGDISLTWVSTPESTNYSISYKVEYTIVNGSTQTFQNNLTTNSCIFPIINIGAGQKFTIKITTIATATGGGTSTSTYTSSIITKASNVSFSDPWLQLTNEKGTESFASYAYNSVYLSWLPATSDDNSSITYQISYNLDGGNWGVLGTTSNTYYTISNLANYAGEGRRIGFYLTAIDKYGQTKDSSYKYITRMAKPIINGYSIDLETITKDGFTYNFDYSFNIPEEKLVCTYYLGYDKSFDETIIPEETFSLANQNITRSIRNLASILASGSSSSITMRKKLYNQVINNQYACPEGELIIHLASQTIDTCYTEVSIPFTYNFATTASFLTGDLIIKQPTLGYYSEGEQISLRFNPLNWKDAAGGTTGAKIIYTIEGNNKTFSNQTPSTSVYNIIDIAPRADLDFNLSYTLKAEIKYSDITIPVESITSSIKIARWTDLDEIYLSSVNKNGTLIEGKIILPDGLCSSSSEANLNKTATKYSLYYENGTSIYLNRTITTTQFNNREISFNFSNSSTGNISIYATVLFVNNNTSVPSIKKTTPVYLIRTAGVPVAIRKGRIGINVDSITFNEQANNSLNSALYVAASTNADNNTPVVEILANSEPTKPKFLSFLQGGVEKSSFYFNSSDGKLHCDNLYVPSSITSVNGYTSGAIVLDADDVGARADSWMPTAAEVATAGTGISISGKTISWSPTAGTGIDISGKTISWSPTAGTGISISGETITNSGVTAVATGGSNGTISVTTNGSTANVSVKGLGSMAYKTDTDYLPKNNGTFTGTLTGPTLTINGTINANVLKGNSIRYGTTTPTTNLAVGQIWLKPKR